MLHSGVSSDFYAADDCKTDFHFQEDPEHAFVRKDRRSKHLQDAKLEDKSQRHNALIFDRTLRSQEKSALIRGIRSGFIPESSNYAGYSNLTRAFFAVAIVMLCAGVLIGLGALFGGDHAWWIISSGLLSIGFLLVSVASRSGDADIDAA